MPPPLATTRKVWEKEPKSYSILGLSLQDFGLNFFQAQSFGLRDNEDNKQKRCQSNCPKEKEKVCSAQQLLQNYNSEKCEKLPLNRIGLAQDNSTFSGAKANVTIAFEPKFVRTARLIPFPLVRSGNISDTISQLIGPNDI